MKTLAAAILLFSVCACTRKPLPKAAALPDNVLSDKPIVMKEGQALALMKEGDRDLMIGVSVVDGKLCIAEIDPKGRSFGVNWKDSETWETSTTVSDGKNHTFVMDRNMDGYADLKTESTPSGTSRFELKNDQWVPLESRKSSSEGPAATR